MGKNDVNEFIKNSEKLLKVERDVENNAQLVLNNYKELSETKGEDSDMCRLANSFRRSKKAIRSNNEDFYNDSRIAEEIEGNFNQYLSEDRSPSKRDLSSFKKTIRRTNESLKNCLKFFDITSKISKKS